MGCQLTLLPSNQGAGFARLRITQWRGDQPPTQLSIARNSDHYFLSSDGVWTPTENKLNISAQPTDSGYEVEFPPQLVDSLVGASNLRYQVVLSNAQLQDVSVINIDPQVVTSFASRISQAPEPQAQPETIAEPENLVTDEQPQPAPVQEPQGKSGYWLIAAVSIAILAIAAWWLYTQYSQPGSEPVSPQQAEQQEQPVQTEAAEVLQVAKPCELIGETGQSEQQLLQACLASKPSTQTLKQFLVLAEQQQRCDLAYRLYVHQSRTNAAIAEQFAARHDPQYFQYGGCIERADLETASYWYRRAAELDPDNVQLKLALGRTLTELYPSGIEHDEGVELLKQAAEAGLPEAKQLLEAMQK